MDPALKQRLLGAAVLVALAVIFLPMLLDSPTPPSGETVRVDIPPPPDRRFETRVVPLETPGPVSDPSGRDAVALPTEDEVVAHRTEVPARIDALSGEDTSGAAGEGRGEETSGSAGETKAEAESAGPAEPARTGRRPTTQLPATAGDGSFVVNLGSFGQRGNADSLVAQMRSMGIPAEIDAISVEGRSLLRVTSGPYRTRTEADQVRLAAQRAVSGLAPSVAELTEPMAASGEGARAAGWAVQVGVFGQEDNALALRDRLRQGGFAAWVDRIDGGTAPNWRVRVGPEAERANADRLKDRLQSRFQLEGLVVAHP